MRQFTDAQKRNGELVVRRLSLEAQMFYENSDPFHIYEVEGDETFTLKYKDDIIQDFRFKDYYVDGFGDLVGPLSFNELNSWLTDEYYDSGMYEEDEEYELAE